MADFDENAATAQMGGWSPNPADWEPIYAAAAQKYGVPEGVLKALTHVESSGQANVTSGAGAEGPQQIMPQNKSWLGIDNSFDPRQAIPASANYLAQALHTSNGNWSNALKLYAGGPDQSKWGTQTNGYPLKIADAYTAQGGDAERDLGIWHQGQPASSAEPRPPSSVGPQLTSSTAPNFSATVAAPAPGAKAPDAQEPNNFDELKAIEQMKGLITSHPAQIPLQPSLPQPQSQLQPQPAAGLSGFSGVIPSVIGSMFPTLKPLTDVANNAAQHSQGSLWSAPAELVNGLMLGQAPNALATIQSAGQGQEAYARNSQQIAAMRELWQEQNPRESVVLPAVGALPSVLGGEAVAGQALRGAAGLIGRALPETGNALSGLMDTMTNPQGLSLVPRTGANIAQGAGRGAFDAGLMSGQSTDPTQRQVQTGATVGGVMGAVAPPVLNPLFKVLNPIVRPTIAKLAQEYDRLLGNEAPEAGLKLAQISQTAKPAEKLAAAKNPEQLPAFTKQLSKTIGENTENLTRDVFVNARDRIGQTMDNIASKSGMANDGTFYHQLDSIKNHAVGNAIDPKHAEVVDKVVQSIENQGLLVSGNIPGDVYQKLTQKHGLIDNLINSREPTYQHYGIQLRGVLDDALERATPADEVAALRDARQQWKNTVVLQRLVDTSPSGIINPQQLQGAVSRIYKSYGWNQPSVIRTLGDVGKLLPRPDNVGSAAAKGFSSRIAGWLQHTALGAMGGLAENAVHSGGMPLNYFVAPAIGASAALAGHKLFQEGMEAPWLRTHAMNLATGQGNPINSLGDILARRFGVQDSIPGVGIPLVTNLENQNRGAPR